MTRSELETAPSARLPLPQPPQLPQPPPPAHPGKPGTGTSTRTSTSTFTSIPILSLAEARSPATKARFLAALRDALLHVGFLYLSDTGLAPDLVAQVGEQTRLFFDELVLPLREKERIEMKNEKSFLGWSRLDNETTAHHTDHREQLDLSTTHPIPDSTAPLYHNLLAPNQWPSGEYLPDFRSTFEAYISQLGQLSVFFTSLVAEAIGLPSNAFDAFFDLNQQHKLKLVKYPEATEATNDDDVLARQGVGPHKDSMLTSYLLQVTGHKGLQVQNLQGQWIDALPVDGTLVVAFGQGLEALTGGVCRSTTHRVLSPRAGEGARLSVPFFQGVSYDARFEEMNVPSAIKQLAIQARSTEVDDVEFTFRKGTWNHLGEATLANRVKSHPDVGEKWYPDLLYKIRQEQQRASSRQQIK